MQNIQNIIYSTVGKSSPRTGATWEQSVCGGWRVNRGGTHFYHNGIHLFYHEGTQFFSHDECGCDHDGGGGADDVSYEDGDGNDGGDDDCKDDHGGGDVQAQPEEQQSWQVESVSLTPQHSATKPRRVM